MYSLIIIDDEKEILDGLSNFYPWKQIGFEVIGSFSYATAALDFCERIMPDVVLTDIRLPFKSGFDVLKELCIKEPHPLFCVMSAYDEFKYAKEAIQYGVQNYLVKPVSFDELTRTFTKIKSTLDSRAVSFGSQTDTASYSTLIRHALEIMKKRTRDCTLCTVAEELEVSEAYLSRLFKKETKINFQKYLQDVKMNLAVSMLESSIKYKNREIAEALGYTDSQNFCRVFRKVYGISPQEYRERRKKAK